MDKTKISKDNIVFPEGNEIFEYCLTQLGKDASPKDLAPDELGCAETVTTILNHLFPDVPVLIGTTQLYDYLLESPYFAKVGTPMAGDIIISPTGFGGFNGITNGHTGFVGNNDSIMSNSSLSPNVGKFLQNYTYQTWVARWGKLGGYPVLTFRRINQ